MKELLLYLADSCGFLFNEGRYKFVDSRVGSSFGDAMVVLESSNTRMRFTRDRGQLLMTFQPIELEPGEWFSIGLLRGVLTGERGTSEVLTGDWAAFLESSIDELESRFSTPSTKLAMIEDLRYQEELRARELFG